MPNIQPKITPIYQTSVFKFEDLDAVQEMAANARAGQETAEARLAALEARLSALEAAGPGGAAKKQPDADPSEGGTSEVAPGTMPPGSKAPGSTMPPSPDGVA